MVSDRPEPSDSHRVIMFRPRHAGTGRPSNVAPKWVPPAAKSPFEELKRHQRDREVDDHRHHMKVNVLGLAFCIVLAIAGVWLVNEMAEMKRVQDCVLSGRSNCLPLKLPVHNG